MPAPTIHFKAETTTKGFLFKVIKCKNLPNTDSYGWNKTDAYIRVQAKGQPPKRTPAIKDSLNPAFKQDNMFAFSGGLGTEVELVCMDWDPMTRDDVVARATVTLTKEILRGGEQAARLVLEGRDKSAKLTMSNSSIGDNVVATRPGTMTNGTLGQINSAQVTGPKPNYKLGAGACVAATASLGPGVEVGAGASVAGGAVVEEGAMIGAGARLEAGAVVLAGAVVPAGAVVRAGQIFGAENGAGAREGAGAGAGAGTGLKAGTGVREGVGAGAEAGAGAGAGAEAGEKAGAGNGEGAGAAKGAGAGARPGSGAGAGAGTGAGAREEGSLIGPGVTLSPTAEVINSTIGAGSVIGNNAVGEDHGDVKIDKDGNCQTQ